MKTLSALSVVLLTACGPRMTWEVEVPSFDAPVEVERSMYRAAPADSHRALYNDAVHAELQGDLDEALRLAETSYTMKPTRRGLRLIEEIEVHAEAIGHEFSDVPLVEAIR